MMQPQTFDNVVVYAFWASKQPNEPHTGWGMHRTHLLILQLFLLYALATLLVLIVVDQAGASAPVGLMGLSGGVLAGSSLIIFARYNRYLGFYEIDRRGQPVRYLDQEPLPHLRKRLPVRRRTFLRAVVSQD